MTKASLKILPCLLCIVASSLRADFVYVPDGNASSGTCLAEPFATTQATEWRYQLVLTPEQLGDRRLRITGISFAPCTSGTFTASTLEIRMSHVSGLLQGGNFGANLPNPVVVRSARSFSWTLVGNTWTSIPLDQAFDYNGRDHLTVEIRYKGGVARFGAAMGQVRGGCIRGLFSSGPGSYTTQTASQIKINTAPKVGFEIAATEARGPTRPGTQVSLRISSPRDAGRSYQMAASFSAGPMQFGRWRLQLSLDALFIVSVRNQLPGIFVGFSGVLDQNGRANAAINIPNTPAVIGLRLHVAFVTLQNNMIATVGQSAVINIEGQTAAPTFGQHPNGYAVGGINFSKTNVEPTIYIVDSRGNVVRSVAAGAGSCHGLVMGPNNQLLYATSLDGNIYRIDPVTGTNLGSFVSIGASLREIAVDHNGDLFTGDTFPNDAVYKIDGVSRAISTLYSFGSGWDPGEGGINIDINTGELLVLGDGNGDNLWLMSRDGSGFTTVASGMGTRYGHCQHLPTGDIYSGTGGANFLLRLPTVSTVPTVFIATPNGDNMYCVKADRAAAPQQRLIGGLWDNANGRQGIHSVNLATRVITTITSSVKSRNTTIYSLEILYRRNVHSVRTGRGKWNVGLRIPEEAGKGYVLGVGASGIVPGVPLSNGLNIYLNLDTLTFNGVAGQLAPFLINAVGTLDATGSATVQLDLSLLGPRANGLRLWFVGVVLDQSAPAGFSAATDPHVVVIEGL